MRTVKVIQEEINGKRDELAGLFDDHKVMDGEKATYEMSPETVQQVRDLNDELTELGRELDDAK